MVVPPNGRFMTKSSIKMDNVGVALFQETSIHVYIYIHTHPPLASFVQSEALSQSSLHFHQVFFPQPRTQRHQFWSFFRGKYLTECPTTGAGASCEKYRTARPSHWILQRPSPRGFSSRGQGLVSMSQCFTSPNYWGIPTDISR